VQRQPAAVRNLTDHWTGEQPPVLDTRTSSGKRDISLEGEEAAISITLPRDHEEEFQAAIAPPEWNITTMR